MAQWTANGGSASGALSFAFDGDGLSYELSAQDTTLDVTSAMLPVPVSLSMASSRNAVTVPLEAGAVGDFALTVAYRDVAVGDDVWSLFDPTGQLPREPATIAIAMSGTAEVTVDVTGDPEAMMAMEEPPARPETLDLTELLVRFAGAELTGSGALTFPGDDPVPVPVGAIDLSLTGGNALLDGLVAMGVVQPGAAQMARGMVGAIARPTGDDALESTITFGEDGSIRANGMQLR